MSEDVYCVLLPNRRRKDRTSSMLTTTPLMDVVEHAEGYYLYCNVPGTECDDVELNVHKGVLHLRAEAVLSSLAGKIHAFEICDAVYEARFRLSAAIDAQNIQACFSDGVLRVTLPFSQKRAPIKIPIHQG